MNKTRGVLSQRITNLTLSALLVATSIFTAVPFLLSSAVSAVDDASYSPVSLSGWTTDRTFPSGGVSQLTFAGRSALQLSVDNENASTLGNFYRTEGVKKAIPQVDSIKADVYVDSEWINNNIDVRAGLWSVGRNAADAISAYPIAEFTNTDAFTGWRIWNSNAPGGWVTTAVPYTTDDWNSLELTINKTDNTRTDVYINGVMVGQSEHAETEYFREIILNSYNYATTADKNYSVRWSNVESGVYKPDAPSDIRFTRTSDASVIADGSTVNYDGVTLRWTVVPNAERYQIRITDPNGLTQANRQQSWYTYAINDQVRHGYFGTIQGEWTYEVRTKDATSGVWSDYSEPLSLSFDSVKPVVSLLSPTATTFTNGTDIVIRATDNVGLNKVVANVYKASNPGSVFKPTQSSATGLTTYDHTIDMSGVPDGEYFVKFNATDRAGNLAQTKTFTFTIDTTAPSAPILTSPSNGAVVNGASVTQSWSTADTDVDYYVYESYNDAAATSLRWSEQFTSNSKTATNVANAEYWWRVKAVDMVGNESDWSNLWKITVDNDDPVATLTAPIDGDVLNGTIDIRGSVSDSNLLRYYFVIKDSTNAIVFDQTVTTDEFSDALLYSWDTTAVADGEYTLFISSRDKADNKDGDQNTDGVSVDRITVTVDNTAPEVAITSPATAVIGEPLVLTGTILGEFSEITVTVDGVPFVQPAVDVDTTTGIWSLAYDTSALSAGVYTVTVSALDGLGNASTVESLDVTVTEPAVLGDTTDPETPEQQGGTSEDVEGTDNPTQTQGASTPTITGPGNDPQVLGDNSGDESSQTGSTDVEGVDTVAQALTVDSDENQGTFAGLAWYWWLLIIAAIATLIGIISRSVRNRAQ